MKKFLIFACCFILLLEVTYIPVKAVEATMDFPDIFFAPHIFYGLNNGVEYDFGKYSEYDNPLAAKNAFYQDLFYDLTGQNYDDVDVNNYMSSFYTMDFGYTTSQYNQLLSGYSQYVLDPSLSFTLPWTTSGIASWNRYNDFYVDQYLSKVNAMVEEYEPPAYSTDPYYMGLNSDGYNTYSVTCIVNGSFYNINWRGQLVGNDLIYPFIYLFPDGYYAFCGSTLAITPSVSHDNNIVVLGKTLLDSNVPIFNSWSDAVAYGQTGVLESDDAIVLAPDVIRNPETGDMIGNDIPVPNVPDLSWDLGKLNDLINDAFENGATVTWDDVIDNDVITHEDGTTLEDDDTKEEPIQDVIEEEQDVPFDDIIPPPPPPPPPIKKWNFDFDPDDPDPRPQSLSVLARIVNVTNKSLPEDLMIMFWGICATLLILGLIKIMHK